MLLLLLLCGLLLSQQGVWWAATLLGDQGHAAAVQLSRLSQQLTDATLLPQPGAVGQVV
jgi:hypothetical protein